MGRRDNAPLPVPVWALAGAALAFAALPLVGMATRIPWGSVPELLGGAGARDALRVSLLTSTAATAVTAALGIPAAVAISRLSGRTATVARTLAALPMVMPPVVAGLALTSLLGRRGLLGPAFGALGIDFNFTIVAVVIAQVFVAMPFLVVPLEAALRAVGTEYDVVAGTLGGRPGYVLRTVTLPMVLPAVVAGTGTAFARALGEFGATLTYAGSLQGTTRTMPMEIYLQREMDTPSALALALVLLVVAVVVLGAASWLANRWTRSRHG